jgi:hypothetical protein
VPEFRCGARILFSFPARIRTSNKWSEAECLREERAAEHRSELASEGAELIALVMRRASRRSQQGQNVDDGEVGQEVSNDNRNYAPFFDVEESGAKSKDRRRQDEGDSTFPMRKGEQDAGAQEEQRPPKAQKTDGSEQELLWKTGRQCEIDTV